MRICLIILILFFSNTAYCCSCTPHGELDDQQYNKYDMIFKGKVLSVRKSGIIKVVVFEVETLFKGTGAIRKLTVKTMANESECGISPKAGEVWLIFAYKEKNEYQTNLCTRTKNMNKKAWNYKSKELEDDLDYLGQKVKFSVH